MKHADNLHLIRQVQEEDEIAPESSRTQPGHQIVARRKAIGALGGLPRFGSQIVDEAQSPLRIILRNVERDRAQVFERRRPLRKGLHTLAARRSATIARSSA